MKLKRKVEEIPPKVRSYKSGDVDRVGELLTQAQVNNLPDGAEIVVIWAGGNGPHRYSVERGGEAAEPFAITNDGDGADGLRLTKVGREKNQTMVWLLEEAP